jgi:hypothetical protein
MFISRSPSACRFAPKARKPHLHWVCTGRVDIPQPAGGFHRLKCRLDANVGIGFPERKRRFHNFVRGGAPSCAVAHFDEIRIVKKRMILSPNR